jgi:hypothetical protein
LLLQEFSWLTRYDSAFGFAGYLALIASTTLTTAAPAFATAAAISSADSPTSPEPSTATASGIVDLIFWLLILPAVIGIGALPFAVVIFLRHVLSSNSYFFSI